MPKPTITFDSLTARCALSLQPGDTILVHAGFAVGVIPEKGIEGAGATPRKTPARTVRKEAGAAQAVSKTASPARPAPAPARKRILEALRARPMTCAALAKALGYIGNSAQVQLSRMKAAGLVENQDGMWGLKGSAQAAAKSASPAPSAPSAPSVPSAPAKPEGLSIASLLLSSLAARPATARGLAERLHRPLPPTTAYLAQLKRRGRLATRPGPEGRLLYYPVGRGGAQAAA